MLIFPVGDADIVAMLEAKPKVVLMQSASVASPPLLTAIARARKGGTTFKVLLGPKPDYEIINNQIMVGSRPYAFRAGAELDALKAADVPIYINPNFNELRGTEVVPGAASHASYLVTDTGASLICTGTWNDAGFRQRNICAQSNERTRALALTSLHSADFDYERQADERSQRERAARQTLVICPDCEATLRDLFTGGQSLTIHTSGIGDAAELTALLRRKAMSIRFLLPAAYRGQNPLIDEMKKLGSQVRYVDYDTDGLTVSARSPTGAITGLLSSLRLTQNSLRQSREVGVQLDCADSVLLSQWLDREWNNARP